MCTLGAISSLSPFSCSVWSGILCKYLKAAVLFSLAHVSLSYTVALKEQPTYPLLPAPFDVIIPAILAGFGQLLVISSTWALGITGTFLGDYFGILMDHVGLHFLDIWTGRMAR